MSDDGPGDAPPGSGGAKGEAAAEVGVGSRDGTDGGAGTPPGIDLGPPTGGGGLKLFRVLAATVSSALWPAGVVPAGGGGRVGSGGGAEDMRFFQFNVSVVVLHRSATFSFRRETWVFRKHDKQNDSERYTWAIKKMM